MMMMTMQDFERARQLLNVRHDKLANLTAAQNRTPVAGPTLAVSLGGLPIKDLAELVRPVIARRLIDEIDEIDGQLESLGLRADPIPAELLVRAA